MFDMVLLLQVPECGDKRLAIIRNDLDQCAPAAQDILEYPIANGLRGFFMEYAEFGVVCE